MKNTLSVMGSIGENGDDLSFSLWDSMPCLVCATTVTSHTPVESLPLFESQCQTLRTWQKGHHLGACHLILCCSAPCETCLHTLNSQPECHLLQGTKPRDGSTQSHMKRFPSHLRGCVRICWCWLASDIRVPVGISGCSWLSLRS